MIFMSMIVSLDEFGHRLSVFVAVDRYSGIKASVVVPSKGSSGAFAAKRVVELINEGRNKDNDIIIKSDPEPAINFLLTSFALTGRVPSDL